MNPLLRGHSGTTPEAPRNVFTINQGTSEDDSQSNPHPEAGLLISVREDRHDMVTAGRRESVEDRDTGVQNYLQTQATLPAFACKKDPYAIYMRYLQFTCRNG